MWVSAAALNVPTPVPGRYKVEGQVVVDFSNGCWVAIKALPNGVDPGTELQKYKLDGNATGNHRVMPCMGVYTAAAGLTVLGVVLSFGFGTGAAYLFAGSRLQVTYLGE